jgi:hypothetical protein
MSDRNAETVLACQTWNDLARSVAWDFGIDLSHDDAEGILWEYTGLPGFWQDDPRAECEAQLRSFFGRVES